MLDNLTDIIGLLDALPSGGRVVLSSLVFAFISIIVIRCVNYLYAGFNITFFKVLLITSLILPLTIGYALDLRFVFSVYELPDPIALPTWIWPSLYLIWGIGAFWKTFLLIRRIVSIPQNSRHSIKTSRKIMSRLEIWSRRMQVQSAKGLLLDGENRPRLLGWPHTRLALPVASERWRTSTIDAVLVHDLALVKINAPMWLIFSEFIASIYWFAPWMSRFTHALNTSFQGLADAHATSILRDELGYNSALRNIGNRIGDDLDRFPLDSLISQWENAGSVTERIEQKKRAGYADPKYDRVFWSLSLVVLLVYVLTGTTLDHAREEEDPSPFLFLYESELEWGRSKDYDDKELETIR